MMCTKHPAELQEQSKLLKTHGSQGNQCPDSLNGGRENIPDMQESSVLGTNGWNSGQARPLAVAHTPQASQSLPHACDTAPGLRVHSTKLRVLPPRPRALLPPSKPGWRLRPHLQDPLCSFGSAHSPPTPAPRCHPGGIQPLCLTQITAVTSQDARLTPLPQPMLACGPGGHTNPGPHVFSDFLLRGHHNPPGSGSTYLFDLLDPSAA